MPDTRYISRNSNKIILYNKSTRGWISFALFTAIRLYGIIICIIWIKPFEPRSKIFTSRNKLTLSLDLQSIYIVLQSTMIWCERALEKKRIRLYGTYYRRPRELIRLPKHLYKAKISEKRGGKGREMEV